MDPRGRVLWPVLAGLVALAAFLSTMQTGINGSVHAYATDVGEIQNALPRWGLIHRSGYPLYTALGSVFVNLLRWAGVEPAASASLYSALWGALAMGLLVALAQELGLSGPAALLGSLVVSLSTTMWVFGSVAEVHTLTLVFSLATLWFAVRFGRSGSRVDLLWLAVAFSQGVMHQRSAILLAPAVLAWIWPQWRAVWQGVLPALGLALLAPLTYLYMPVRVWTGADWVFGSPGTWDGFWLMLFDNRAGRVVKVQANPDEWRQRLDVTLRLLAGESWWPLLIVGLAGLLLLAFRKRGWRDSLALTVIWALNLALTFSIWRGRVVDAQLAALLPITLLAGLGWAVLVDWTSRRSRLVGAAVGVILVLALGAWGWRVRPFVLSITRDPSAEEVIATVARAAPPRDGRPTTLVSTWGLDYWALAYAQAWRGELPGLNLVDHNADLSAIVARGHRLLIPSKILHVFPVARWEERLGRLYLSSEAPGVVEMHPTPPVAEASVPLMDAGARGELIFDGIRARAATLERSVEDEWLLTVYWQAEETPGHDYSVAVHLLAHDPPLGPADILAQADSLHPVDGWYPTSRWSRGEIVRDTYAVHVPPDSEPVAVRVALYRSDPQDGFVTSPWLVLPAPGQ